MRSIDNGVTWTSIPTPGGGGANNTYYGLAYGNGCFIGITNEAVGSQEPYIIKSQDGLHWYSILGLQVRHAWQFMCYGNGMFVAVAKDGVGTRIVTSGILGLGS